MSEEIKKNPGKDIRTNKDADNRYSQLMHVLKSCLKPYQNYVRPRGSSDVTSLEKDIRKLMGAGPDFAHLFMKNGTGKENNEYMPNEDQFRIYEEEKKDILER